eukprot:TRINITY_DN5358_c0_g1_i1.p1 TRINITY_DN5358_c0_g1~~TRINITY_DN5358_c0_g1_i1.p1  ORF type:complete len:670 (+),score=180.88 TRINITY_DN5358_c0_g1_i1:69-2078(+)
MSSERNIHGTKGVYYGGDWLPIEDCDKVYCNIDAPSRLNGSKRKYEIPSGGSPMSYMSRTKFTSTTTGKYDIVIIGAGAIGSMIARELSKTTASVLLLEAADDVTQGATKGNSGIVHAGYDDKPGSVRAKYCWPGNQLFPQLDKELRFGYERNGSLVVAKGPEDEAILEELLERGHINGVENLRIIDRDELFEMEPLLDEHCTAALYSPDAGTLIPYEYAIALAENAADNGVEVRVRRKVVDIQKHGDGSKGFTITAHHWEPSNATIPTKSNNKSFMFPVGIVLLLALYLGGVIDILLLGCGVVALGVGYFLTSKGSGSKSNMGEGQVEYSPSPGTTMGGNYEIETIETDYIVNCGGCKSDLIAHMVGDDSFKIKPRIGEYILLHKKEGGRVTRTLFPTPHPVLGKGVLVQSTLWGNLILGPTARDILVFNEETQQYEENPDVVNEGRESIMKYILGKCKRLVPSIAVNEVIHSFSGSRAKSTRGDWVIEHCQTAPGMIHAAAIDSPGIAGSPAIAMDVVKLLAEVGAPVNEEDPDFNPNRDPIIIPKDGWKGIKCGDVGKYTDPRVNVVCKCERVTEQEVINACSRSLPIDSTQAIRKRTRAGMGHCQGDPSNYGCEQRVAAIIAREKGIPVESVGTRPWPASSLMSRRWFDDEERALVASYAVDDDE